MADALKPSSSDHNWVLFWFHVPKTGGTTFRHQLERQLGTEEGVLHLTDRWRARKSLESVESIPRSDLQRVRAVVGHDLHVDHQHLFEPRAAKKLTFIREPGEWAKSAYRYSRHMNRSRWRTFTEFVHERPADAQASFLAGRLLDPRLPAQAAKHQVVAELGDFYLVGSTEQLDEITEVLFSVLGLRPPRSSVRLNSSDGRPESRIEVISEQDVDVWRERCGVDRQLHELAKQATQMFLLPHQAASASRNLDLDLLSNLPGQTNLSTNNKENWRPQMSVETNASLAAKRKELGADLKELRAKMDQMRESGEKGPERKALRKSIGDLRTQRKEITATLQESKKSG